MRSWGREAQELEKFRVGVGVRRPTECAWSTVSDREGR